MAPRSRKPNLPLAALMREGQVGNAQLARTVNRVGAELGVSLHYDKTTVSHWLKGSLPKAAARPAVVEALARLLARPVTSSEAGLGDLGEPAPAADAASGVVELGTADLAPIPVT